ncbi:laminin subunit beta-4 [Anguilla anguilla]|uniref:laminin subunit beta-4 n=1 Tax=Anguilla anguilla TaxID=7936 RepID=UPI0015AA2035|nr:laminin subunit beta-4 [Anguilla anguilla]
MITVGTPLILVLYLVGVVQPQDDCNGISCHPQLGDLMVGRNAQLSATSTCGLDGPQKYCILGYLEDEQKCFICDSRQPYNRYNNPNSHQIENIITTFDPERKMKWWQSENGVHQVSIKLDLESLFQFSHLVLTFKSFRPASMLVERSKDYGRTWKVFRYFAEDCRLSFPGISEGPADSVDDVICDSRYSGAEPSTDGEVVLKALDPNFQIDDPYTPEIQDLITLTNLRVNFTRLLTLGDTLLGRKRRNPEEKYYYALYEMVVRGSCFCNGHAAQCVPAESTRGDVFTEPGMVHGRCVCHHNTAGNNCERCQDFYNDTPWRPAGQSDSSACKRCNCNGHSDQCHFDIAVYLASGEVSGGVCDDCRNNRVGIHCEECSPFFFQDPRVPTNHPNACIPCDCDPDGSLNGGLCDPNTGQCVCKNNVEGDRCDRCKYGFFGLKQEDPEGCQACRCNVLGSVQTPYPCDQVTGVCICQRLAIGPLCDQCLPGYWGLGNTVHSCSPCDCDIGGAYNSRCSPVDGQCQCLPNMVGRTCNDPAPGYFLAPLDFYLYEAERAAPIERRGSSLANPTLMPECEEYYRERGYDLKYRDGQFVLVKRTKRRARQRRQSSIPVERGSAHQLIPRQRTEGQAVTWTGPGFVRVQDGAGLRFTVNNLPASLDYALIIRFEPETSDNWAAIVKVLLAGSPGDEVCPAPGEKQTVVLSGSGRTSLLDPFMCLNHGGEYHIEIVFEQRTNDDPRPSAFILIDSIGLVPKIDSLQNFCSDLSLDEFQRYGCIGLGVDVGLPVLPEVCEKLIISMSARIHNGAVRCRCNAEGAVSTSCSKLGGQCQCKPNVIGRCCDSCTPQTFGFGPDGCTRCDCDPQGSIEQLCDQVSGQCSCRKEVTGRQCDRCLPRHFGFPQCRPCQCNALADHCDPTTGVCLACSGHSTGPNCERCEEGYYGNPVSREPCEPCLCPGSQASERFFAQSCSKDPNTQQVRCNCNPGHTGAHCDVCSPGFYGDLTLPGERCDECPCNNNIDPLDRNACNSVTGECLRCLHNTTGPQCQSCKPGYYGDALAQNCKACSCDPRGTEITLCPVGNPCRCDQLTGNCTCRTGVVGALCTECADGFWNFEGASGCQPCDCDPTNSLNNHCNKTTGQCQCRPEYGGKQCDECGENYFGNPDLQCISCDCNMEGTGRPACDSYTGECICRPGVTGIFCDECAPGYESTFPECAPCHPCSLLWAGNVTDVKAAAQKMRSLVPGPGDRPQPDYEPQFKRMKKKLAQLAELVDRSSLSHPEIMDAEKLCKRIQTLKDSIDPHVIIIDKTALLNTDIDNIKYEFSKLLDRLIEKIKPIGPKTDLKEVTEALEKIKKYHAKDVEAEKQMKQAKAMLESSKDKRREAKDRLDRCNRKDWASLERMIKSLSVSDLNEDICGAPGDAECSEAKCGGALCKDALGARKCGGPNCKGSLPVSQDATKTTEKTKNAILDLLRKLRDSTAEISRAKQQAQDTKDQAEKMMKKIDDSKEKFEKEKNGTKDLIKRVKDYLKDEMVTPEDIEKVARAVLAINLPAPPDAIRAMIEKIRDVLVNCSDLQENLKNLQDQVKTAQDLLEKAKEVQDKTKNIDTGTIKKAIEDAEKAQDVAKKNLEEAERDKDTLDNKLKEIEGKLSNTEINLDPQRIKDLVDATEALKNKTEMNRQQAKDAKAAADSAQADAKDVEQDLKNVTDLFETLKKMGPNQSPGSGEVNDRLKNITMEAEKLAKEVQDKMQQANDLEKRIEDLVKKKDEKEEEVAQLLEEAKALRMDLAERAAVYINC